MNITEPERGTVPQCTSSRALPRPGNAGRMDPAEQWAARSLTMFAGLTVDHDGRLYGHPRGGSGREVTAESIAAWVGAEHPAWQSAGMRPADWQRVIDLLIDRVRTRDAVAAAATPPDAKRAAELNAERVRAARRHELELQAAQAQAELAEFAETPEPPEADAGVEPVRSRGWMRRAPMPP